MANSRMAKIQTAVILAGRGSHATRDGINSPESRTVCAQPPQRSIRKKTQAPVILAGRRGKIAGSDFSRA